MSAEPAIATWTPARFPDPGEAILIDGILWTVIGKTPFGRAPADESKSRRRKRRK